MLPKPEPEEVYNFCWQKENQIATGGKPCREGHLEWLRKQGVAAIVILEEIPTKIMRQIYQLEWEYYRLETEDDFSPQELETTQKQALFDFITANLAFERRVYICCSAGITRSVKLARAYLAERENYGPIQAESFPNYCEIFSDYPFTYYDDQDPLNQLSCKLRAKGCRIIRDCSLAVKRDIIHELVWEELKGSEPA